MKTAKFFAALSASFCLCAIFANSVFAQSAAKDIAKIAVEFERAGESISYLKKRIPQIPNASDKRSLLIFLASLEEQISSYNDASYDYAQAAGISAPDADGMPKRTNAQLVLDAIRCALCVGDSTTADNYLNSAVRNSTDANIQATIKLYEVWSTLCKTESADNLEETILLLRTYINLPSLQSVKPQLLLTLWYVTGEAEYGNALKREFPKSLESEIVNGKIQLMPVPFWYFMPKRGAALAQSAQSAAEAQKIESTPSSSSSDGAKALKHQLGLFKNKENADSLSAALREKGFAPYITEERRTSGNLYYIVVVDENAAGTIGQQLKSAGFESYQIFE